MICEMCGKETELYRTLVEGTELNVCKECGKFGTIVGKIKRNKIKKPKIIKERTKEKELIQLVVSNYGKIVKKKREQLGLKQKDLAKAIAERESLIHNIESGKLEPSIALARKLEKFLKIKLIEEHEEVKGGESKLKSDSYTIGDFIKVKK